MEYKQKQMNLNVFWMPAHWRKTEEPAQGTFELVTPCLHLALQAIDKTNKQK